MTITTCSVSSPADETERSLHGFRHAPSSSSCSLESLSSTIHGYNARHNGRQQKHWKLCHQGCSTCVPAVLHVHHRWSRAGWLPGPPLSLQAPCPAAPSCASGTRLQFSSTWLQPKPPGIRASTILSLASESITLHSLRSVLFTADTHDCAYNMHQAPDIPLASTDLFLSPTYDGHDLQFTAKESVSPADFVRTHLHC